MQTPFLQLQSVSKGFGPAGNRSEVLSQVNLSVNEGEFVAVIGYSGAGKSTLMALLAGLLKPDSGALLLKVVAPDGPGPDRGLVFQNYSLLPWLNVRENVQLAVDAVFPSMPQEERTGHIDRYLEMVGLLKAAEKRPAQLSGGMRQRVSLARTLSMQPEVLLLDEPLSALDALTRGNLQDELSRICRQEKRTVVLITNDPDEALLLADRVVPLSAAPKATLLESIEIGLPHPRRRAELLEDSDFKQLRLKIVEALVASKRGRTFVEERTLVLPDIEPEDISLSDSRVLFGQRRSAKRKKERQKVSVEVPR